MMGLLEGMYRLWLVGLSPPVLFQLGGGRPVALPGGRSRGCLGARLFPSVVVGVAAELGLAEVALLVRLELRLSGSLVVCVPGPGIGGTSLA